ncbi:unnamed protein product [Clavelina lepadiformis]|uniref:C2H2-type domain-containing protein n=1 Tax=Clavelina lepadiformis TaxID=159417 RepID=A0ABP0G2R9_CLALP
MNLSEMTDFEIADFVRSGEESCANQLDDIPSTSGIAEAEKFATQTGARSKEQSQVKPEKKKRIRPKKKCPYCGVMNSNISRHCQENHKKPYHGEGDFECRLCKKRLTSWNGLVRHLRGKCHAGRPEAMEMAASLDRRRKSVPIQRTNCFNWDEVINDFKRFRDHTGMH